MRRCLCCTTSGGTCTIPLPASWMSRILSLVVCHLNTSSASFSSKLIELSRPASAALGSAALGPAGSWRSWRSGGTLPAALFTAALPTSAAAAAAPLFASPAGTSGCKQVGAGGFERSVNRPKTVY